MKKYVMLLLVLSAAVACSNPTAPKPCVGKPPFCYVGK